MLRLTGFEAKAHTLKFLIAQRESWACACRQGDCVPERPCQRRVLRRLQPRRLAHRHGVMGLDRPHLGRRERQGEIGTTTGLWVVGPGLGRSRGLGKLVNSPSLRPDVLPSARFGVRVIFMFHLLCSFLFSFASLRISNFLPLVTALRGLAFTRVDSLSLALSRVLHSRSFARLQLASVAEPHFTTADRPRCISVLPQRFPRGRTFGISL